MAPSQLVEIPMSWVAPAATVRSFEMVPNEVWVNRKTDSEHSLTTDKLWPATLTAARARARTEVNLKDMVAVHLKSQRKIKAQVEDES